MGIIWHGMVEVECAKFKGFVAKQDQALRVAFYLLLNLAEDPKVEEKMRKKKILQLLVSVLERSNEELLILAVSFLKKLSRFKENKEEMKRLNVVEKLAGILLNKNASTDLINAVVRLLLNLSFDSDLRTAMIKVGLLPPLVALLNDERNANPACCVLYHLSMDDRVKSMFTYTDAIPIVMKLILETTEEQVDLEIMALAINLAANKRNAQLICEGQGLRVLMQRAFHYQDPLIMKMIRNISQHDGQTKSLFVEFLADIADAVKRADLEDFRVECLGILGNLNLDDLDFERLLKEFDLVPWMKERLEASVDDDLVLEIVVFIGTCCSDASAARYLCDEGLLDRLIELLKAKQEDDEMVLQVVFVFHVLCSHEETRRSVIRDSDAVAYLIDLMHDKNVEVQRVCDATLDVIAQIDDNWADRVQREKFQFHNAQWLEVIRAQAQQSASAVLRENQEHDDDGSGSGINGLFYSDLMDADDFEQLVREPDDFDSASGGGNGNTDVSENDLEVRPTTTSTLYRRTLEL